MIMKIKWQCNKLILVRLKSDKTVVYKNCDKWNITWLTNWSLAPISIWEQSSDTTIIILYHHDIISVSHTYHTREPLQLCFPFLEPVQRTARDTPVLAHDPLNKMLVSQCNDREHFMEFRTIVIMFSIIFSCKDLFLWNT